MRKFLIAGVVLLAAAGCKGPSEPEWQDVLARADAAEQQWAGAQPVRWTMTEQLLCECTPERTGPVLMEVRRGAQAGSDVLESMVYTAGGGTVPDALRTHFPTPSGLFALIREAARARVWELSVDFHPTLGYPTRIFIDYDERGFDDEVVYLVTSLQAL